MMFDKRINLLAASTSGNPIWGGKKGIEKESLRVSPDGYLSQTPHPIALGSALTNRYITTDFSEALLEFVTPAFVHTWETLRFLCDVHQFSYAGLNDELLWVCSMPCRIGADGDIPLAHYGSSNVGRMKTIYRNGLGLRYGRSMQTIAGVHFNYSMADAFWPAYQEVESYNGSVDSLRSDAYFGLVRNFRRFGWLILYLFGASPALCRSFDTSSAPSMQSLDDHTLYQPFATSLRMSDLGYSNRTQARISISLNDLDEYVDDLSKAIWTPEPAFEKFGTKVEGEYRQLSVNQLQIENEYYSPVRPKRVARSGERPTAALKRGGVEYVEIRSLDINPFDPVGINQNAMRFVEAFAIYCLLQDSPPMDDKGWDESARNHTQTAKYGRDPGFGCCATVSRSRYATGDWKSFATSGLWLNLSIVVTEAKTTVTPLMCRLIYWQTPNRRHRREYLMSCEPRVSTFSSLPCRQQRATGITSPLSNRCSRNDSAK
jgi:glutamate--cysteine ligase